MKIELNTEKLNAGGPIVNSGVFVAPNLQYLEPAASVQGISFPDIPGSPLLVKLAMTAGIVVGTINATGEHRLVPESPDFCIEIILPNSDEWAVGVPVSDKYSRLRSSIERSGIPMLDDEALRAEVDARKGARSEA